ncbi:PucR family transcriptional regulator [Actinokineospora bangkokensis]|uniref:PucR family transcriptional regulator n=1 Tax=Actinokineospora bangkokensis TaxID=1193682 RepID=UPI00117786D6|nr:PucR family transcriptional regulator [Actinokineospora bangkokensis]
MHSPRERPDGRLQTELSQRVELLLATAGDRAARQRALAALRESGRRAALESWDLRTLRLTMRRSARAALRAVAARTGADGDDLGRLAEALLMSHGDITDALAEGFHSATAGPVGNPARDRLVDLLLHRAPTPVELAEAAAEAGWRVPTALVAVHLTPRGPSAGDAPVGLPDDVLVRALRSEALLVVPDPGARLERLTRHLVPSWRVAVGSAVAPERASASLRQARDLARLMRAGVADADCARVEDNLAALMVLRDPELSEAIERVRLTPLDAVDDAAGLRLAQTLLAWLQCGGNTAAAGRLLNVHPQTIRYRMRRLEELFGDDLDDPELRWELEAALRSRLSRS